MCSWRLCMAVCRSGQPIPDSTICSMFIDCVRIIACIICVPCCEARHFACVCHCFYLHGQTGDCHHSLRLQSFNPAWLGCETPTRPVPCDWAVPEDHNVMWLAVGFDEHVYFCIGSSSWVFRQQSLVVMLEVNWMSSLPLTSWPLWGHTHARLPVLLGPFKPCLLPVHSSFCLWQHPGVDSWDSALLWDTLSLAPPYVLFSLVAGPVGNAWPQWVCLLLFPAWLSWLCFAPSQVSAGWIVTGFKNPDHSRWH